MAYQFYQHSGTAPEFPFRYKINSKKPTKDIWQFLILMKNTPPQKYYVCITLPLCTSNTRSLFYIALNLFEFKFFFGGGVAIPRLKCAVCLTILPIARRRGVEFIPFSRVLVLCEMQTVSSRIELGSLLPFPTVTFIAPRVPA